MIATTQEQSARLLLCGVSADTADMDMSQDEIMETEYHLNMPTPIGRFIHEPTHHSLAVYKPISRFKRLMLRWCFGLKFEKI